MTEVRDSAGKGKGIFTVKKIPEGQELISQKPTVLGPKQTSPFVCVDCLDYINEVSVWPCEKCGLPLCADCSRLNIPKYHGAECKLFEDSGKYKSEPVTTYKEAKPIYMYLTPLRFLLEAENSPEILELNANLEERIDTLIYFLTLSKVVKPIHQLLGLGERFSAEHIQKVCGILDTNCFEVKWDRGVARGIYCHIAFINHSCVPNCRKYFDAQRVLHILSSEALDSGQELHISYTNPLFCTTMRQAILNQTKCFKCDCLRCQDPKEFGSNLSALKCKNKSAGCLGVANLIDSQSLDSDLICETCQFVISSDMAKMMQDTAMNSLQESDDPDTCQNNNFNYKTLANLGNAQDTMDNLVNLERFLPQSNHIMVNLKLKLIDQVIANDNERAQFEEIAIKFCFELLQMARLIAPGKSKLRGVLSMEYHQLIEKGPNPIVIPKDYIDRMFAEDQSVLLVD